MFINYKSNQKALSFDDVILQPIYSDIMSRSEIDTSVDIKEISKILNIPIISSPMSTVTESYMCNSMSELGGLGIVHRYNTIDFQVKLLSQITDTSTRSAAIGVSGDYKERLSELIKNGLKIVCLDVAHGHHILVKNAIEYIRREYPDIFIIAGNIAAECAYKDLSDWGVNAVRTSVGSGSICTTRIQTGHGIPTFNAVLECSKARKERQRYNQPAAYIIADGGIKNSGDIVKSLAAGADFVMLGSMISGTKETPGIITTNDKGKEVKKYNGMASKDAQKDWKGSYSSIEGVSSYVSYKGTISNVINEIMSNVRSGMSYSGSRSIEELQNNAIFKIQTSASHIEANPHIFNRDN